MRQKFDIEHLLQIESEYLRNLCIRRAKYIKRRKDAGHDMGAAERELERLLGIADLLDKAAGMMDEVITSLIHQFNVETHRFFIDYHNAKCISEEMLRASEIDHETLKSVIRFFELKKSNQL